MMKEQIHTSIAASPTCAIDKVKSAHDVVISKAGHSEVYQV